MTMLFIRPVYDELQQNDYRRDCCLSHSRVASFRRVCQPFPIARNAVITSSSSRIVVGILVGFFCGPRCRRFISSCNSEKDMAVRKSSFVHSGFSSSIISGLGFLFILCYLPFVCFPETDDPDGIFIDPLVNKDIYSIADFSECPDSGFAIIFSVVNLIRCCGEIKLMHLFKGQSAFTDVLFVLVWVVFNFHKSNCTYIENKCQANCKYNFVLLTLERKNRYAVRAPEKDGAGLGRPNGTGGQPPAERFFRVRNMAPSMGGHAGGRKACRHLYPGRPTRMVSPTLLVGGERMNNPRYRRQSYE
nr:MAG TPA: hypothetical protein [Caudoviricetes sp.]